MLASEDHESDSLINTISNHYIIIIQNITTITSALTFAIILS